MDGNTTNLFEAIMRVAWACLDIHIPISNSVYITPWAVMLFSIFVGMTIRFLFKKGREE